MSNTPWETEFKAVYNRGVAAWKSGRRSASTMFSDEDTRFLASIGCSAQELFDFVDDYLVYGEPDYETARAIQAIRRDYFTTVLGGKSTGRTASMEELPSKGASVEGIPWLPRVIEKARLKLRGEMPPDLMYGCGGDRAFFSKVRMTLPQFLELVRDAGTDNRKIISAVVESSKGQR
jgi:hypothetical protein